jgi:hypothetical protein
VAGASAVQRERDHAFNAVALRNRNQLRARRSRACSLDRYSHLFDGAYSDVNDELEQSWKDTETLQRDADAQAGAGAGTRLQASVRLTPSRSSERTLAQASAVASPRGS